MPTPEQLEIRALARAFAEGEVRPHAPTWDERRALSPDLFRQLAELGFLGLRVPEEHGGLDLDLPTFVLAVEALSWGDAAVGLAVLVHNGSVAQALRNRGSPAQRERWLPAMAAGEALGAFALSEPAAGSDVAAVAATARRRGSEWVLAGEKRWVTNGARAGLLLTFARTDGEPGTREGISAFLVPGGTAGLQVTRRERTMGLRASETVALRFDDLRLSEAALLGEEGEGYRIAMDALGPARLGVAGQCVGIAQAAYEHALSYAEQREQFGSLLREFGGIQEKLAKMAIRIAAARELALRAAERMEEGGEAPGATLPSSPRAMAAMAKVAASEAALWVADEAVQIFGGYGYMKDYPVEKLLRDAKGAEIYEGSNEVLRVMVARDVVREWSGA